MKKIILAMLGVAAMGVAVTANAGIATAPLSPTVTMTAGCTVDVSGANVNFGQYPIGTPDTAGIAGGVIAVTCSPGTTYGLGIDAGSFPNALWGAYRHMVNFMAGVVMPYHLSLNGMAVTDRGLAGIDPSYPETTAGWADSALLGLSATGAAQNYTLTASLFFTQAPVPGTFVDTVNVVVAW